MSAYEFEFHARASAQIPGIPDRAFDALTAALTPILRDPWGCSRQDGPAGEDPAFRWAPFDGGLGAVHFTVHEQERVVRVYDITWTG